MHRESQKDFRLCIAAGEKILEHGFIVPQRLLSQLYLVDVDVEKGEQSGYLQEPELAVV